MWRTQAQNADQTRTLSRFFQRASLPSNSFRSFDYARGNESIIYFTDLCTPIDTYIYARNKHPFASYPAAKHPNAAKLRLQTYDKNQWTFFITPAWASTLPLAIIFKILVSLQNVPFLFRYTIPCLHTHISHFEKTTPVLKFGHFLVNKEVYSVMFLS